MTPSPYRRSSQTSLSSISSASSWRRDSSSQPSTREPGCIFFLKHLEKCQSYRSEIGSLKEGIFGHPVAILEEEGDFAKVLIISSLQEKSLQEYQKGRHNAENVHLEHIPISPLEPHYLTGEQLYLEEGGLFVKPSYLKIKEVHKVPTVCLSPFNDKETGKQLRFCAKSWDELKRIRGTSDSARQLAAPRTPSLSSSASSVKSVSSLVATPASASGSRPFRRIIQNWRPDSTPRPLPQQWEEKSPSTKSGGKKPGFERRNWRVRFRSSEAEA